MAGVPSNIVVPFMGVTFDASMSGAQDSTLPVKLLVIGQRLSTGTIEELIPYYASSPDEVGLKSGVSSMLNLMAKSVFKNNLSIPVMFIGLDDGAGTAATHAWDLTGVATASGEYDVYVKGRRYAVPVAIDDTAAELQTLMVAAITEDTSELPCDAASVTDTLTLTNKNLGVAAGDLDVRFNANRGEVLPAGLALSVVTDTAGTVDPDLADALAVIGDEWFQFIAQPYVDNTNMGVMEDYLLTRASVMDMKEGISYQAMRDTRTNMITFGEDTANRNSQHMATLPAWARRQCTYEIASSVAAVSAVSVQDDPAKPLHRMNIVGIDALDVQDKWTTVERDQLAKAGICTMSDEVGVKTHAAFTMWLKNASGVSDTSYRQQNTMFILLASRYAFINQILTKYSRAKLASNADNVAAGEVIMTLDTARDEAIAWFKQMQAGPPVLFEPGKEALDDFKSALRVEREGADRINWLLPPNLINQFTVGSGIIQFRE